MISFFSGLFIGCFIGVFAMSLFVISGRADNRAEEMRKKAGLE